MKKFEKAVLFASLTMMTFAAPEKAAAQDTTSKEHHVTVEIVRESTVLPLEQQLDSIAKYSPEQLNRCVSPYKNYVLEQKKSDKSTKQYEKLLKQTMAIRNKTGKKFVQKSEQLSDASKEMEKQKFLADYFEKKSQTTIRTQYIKSKLKSKGY